MTGATVVGQRTKTNAGSVAQAKKFLTWARQIQMAGAALGIMEILTMCPTGWFMPTAQGPDYLAKTIEQTFSVAQLKALDRLVDPA